jgi:hypothetical protein
MASATGYSRSNGSGEMVHGNRWRVLVASAALGVAALGLSSCGFPSSSATTTSTGDPSSTVVVECSSGTVTQGDVQTSSLSVTKVPASVQPDLPGGCTVQTG